MDSNHPATPEQFFRAYAARCAVKRPNTTTEAMVAKLLAYGFIAGVCNCDYEGCEGWGMYPSQAALDGWLELHDLPESSDQWPKRTTAENSHASHR